MRLVMNTISATFLLAVIAVSLAVAPLGGAAQATYKDKPLKEKWKQPINPRQRTELLLNRMTFGPRPGDVERVERMGLNKFLDEQLHPQSIDDSAMAAKLQGLQTLGMTPAELAENFPPPQMKAKLLQKERLAALRRQGKAMNAEGSGSDQSQTRSESGPAASLPGAGNPAMRAQSTRPQGPREIDIQLSQEELLRAVYSQRQLQEVMVHFWMNHFNIFFPKGADRYYLTSFEENVIRPHALGNFEDLLVATAESPAMLFYLDNWLSATPNPQNTFSPGLRPGGPLLAGPGMFRPFGPGRFRPAKKKPQFRRGLNENYGRELMELHTIGLHYTQQDVVEVARCFTGWTIRRPRFGGGFYFNPRMHDYGKKVVLGYTIPAGQGIEDGLEVLHILAMSPDTAQHISYQLCQHFVADNPPPELVSRAAKVYLATQGDIPSVLRTILTSPEFYSKGAYRAKVKSPFEFVASSLRALGADTDAGMPLPGFIAQMGEPMFQYEAPSGYDDVAATWINSSSLLMRMNFAIALAIGQIRGTEIDWQALARKFGAAPRGEMMNGLAEQITGGELSPATQSAILSKLTNGHPDQWENYDPGQRVRMMAGLMIASPEFQKR